MNRRQFLARAGAGSLGAGALVGTGGFTSVSSQRRVTIEVDEKVRDDLTAISFIAFCPEVGTEDIEITAQAVNDEGNPVAIAWSTANPVEQVILKGGSEWYRFHADGATSGTAKMTDEGDGELLCDTCPSRVPDDPYDRCSSSPCLGVEGTKIEYDGDGEFGDPEITRPQCPSSRST